MRAFAPVLAPSMWYLDAFRSPLRSRRHSVDTPVPQTYHIECVATLER
jgi:hypothetical protein